MNSENVKALSAVHPASEASDGVRAADSVLALILVGSAAVEELRRAVSKHQPMHSAHEGYAVLLEEMDELWSEIKKQNPERERMRAEALQVAAMGLRFVLDVCGGVE